MKQKHIKALAWAVKEAEYWREIIKGIANHGDMLAIYDKQVAVCKEALKELRRENKDTHVAHVDLQRKKNERTY